MIRNVHKKEYFLVLDIVGVAVRLGQDDRRGSRKGLDIRRSLRIQSRRRVQAPALKGMRGPVNEIRRVLLLLRHMGDGTEQWWARSGWG